MTKQNDKCEQNFSTICENSAFAPLHFGLSLCIRSDIGYEPDCSEDFFNGSYTISDEAPPFWDPNTP